jgi:hypothetical protein
MKSAIAFLALSVAVCFLPALAHKIPPGVYAKVPYNNNPFIFCKLGMPEDGWVATNPRTGTWTATRQYPNLHWVPTYMYICPAGFRPAGGGAPYKPSDRANGS